MEEAESRLVWDSFSAVVAYLVYSRELRESIEKTLEARSLEEFIDALRQRVAAEVDTTRRTDGQIFLSELQRRLRQARFKPKA